MQTNEANIEIVRKNKKLFSIAVVMPMWDKIGDDNFLRIDIPLFNLKTYAQNEGDAESAIEEAIKVFCINAEKFGAGLENELRILGWSHYTEIDEVVSMVYNVSDTNVVMEQIMETGENYAHTHSLELELA